MLSKLRIGVSSCLLGYPVRYDGGHKRHRTVTEHLACLFEIVAVCPEVEAGMGVPREPVNLVGNPRAPRMLGQDSRKDWTEIMCRLGRQRATGFETLKVSGFVLKSESPSCGPDRVPIHTESGKATHEGSGLFARTLSDTLPLLPLETEGRLNDVLLYENFVERIFAYREWCTFACAKPSLPLLTHFHIAHKATLMAHTEDGLRILSQLLESTDGSSPETITAQYGIEYMQALKHPPTRHTNTTALQYLTDLLSARLDPRNRKQLTGQLDDYRLGKALLSAPLALIRHHATECQVEHVLRQSFLQQPSS